MGLISEGIDKVRAFELAGGIGADGQTIDCPRAALVQWRSSWSDKFHQVYVNGQLAGATLDTDQLQLIVQVPSCGDSPVRIEVFAVEAKDVYEDFSSELSSSVYESGRVKIKLMRSQALPMDSTVQVYFDNGTGEIDYDNPLNDTPIQVWPVWQDKAGFGMSRFGVSDFGYDGAAAAGFGRGWFGYGEFGFDADTLEWVSELLEAGTYKFGIKVTDKKGNQSNSTETRQVTVIPAARPAEEVSVQSFDKQSNELILSIS